MSFSMQHPRGNGQRQPHNFSFDIVEIALPLKTKLFEGLEYLRLQPLLFRIHLLLDGLAGFAATLLAGRGHSLCGGCSFLLQTLLEFGHLEMIIALRLRTNIRRPGIFRTSEPIRVAGKKSDPGVR
jgi:hypothetical protein